MNTRLSRIVTALKPRNKLQELLDDMDQMAANSPRITQVVGPVCQDCGSTNVVFEIRYEIPGEDEHGV